MKLIVSEGGVRLFLPPGKGKTATVLKAFTVLKNLGMVDALLVLAPLRVITTSWPGQLEKWSDFEHLKYVTIHGGKTERIAAMRTEADVYLMNVEGLLSSEWKLGDKKRGYPLNPEAVKWLQGKRVMLAVDESTKFKNYDSTRSKTLKRYLPYFCRRVIMTGTPKPNKLEDLFFQCYITDMGQDLGGYVTHFRNEYMQMDFNRQFVPQKTGAERCAQKIAPTTLQLEEDDAIPVQEVDIWVPMPPEAKEIYKELEREFIAVIEDETVLAGNTGVLLGKLRQIAQGALYKPEKEEGWFEIHGAKLDALETLLEELNGDPAFMLYQFQHDMARISERLGKPVPYVGGGVGAAQGAALCAAFAAGGVPLLGGHPQSVAHGVDGLQNNCRNVIWFGLDWSWENYYQANKRIAREGTKAESVMVYRILVDCKIERALLAAITDKRSSEADFLKILRAHLLH